MKTIRRFLLSCLILWPAMVALGQVPATRSVRLDAQRQLIVEVTVPAGFQQAVLEISPDLSSPAPWRTMIAGAIDGRAATVTFRLPPQAGASRMFARVRTATATALPAAELNDPALYTIDYGGTIDDSAKLAFLTAAGAKMIEWAALPRSQKQAGLIAWALTDPNVASAQVSTLADNVSIRFRDGDICILANKPRQPGNTSGPASAFSAAVPAPPVRQTKANTLGSLPGSSRTITAFSLESSFDNSAPTIGGWLASSGYVNTNFASTTVPQIIGWSSPSNPIGVLFWHAHGCTYVKADGTQGVAIATGQKAIADYSDPNYKPMRLSGELLLSITDGETVPAYTLTSEFVRNRMRFAPSSLVVLDTCYAGAGELAQAFLEAGAGTYISWDWESGTLSGSCCRKIFDRLLGMNQETPVSTPHERPFALRHINYWMLDQGYDIDPSEKYTHQTRLNARLMWFDHPTTPANILKPTIMRVLAEAGAPGQPFSKYLIEGDFGSDPGETHRSVKWAGQSIPVLEWDAEEGIVIRIPAKPPAGNLQITLNKEFESLSNEVPITEWTAPFRYEIHAEGSLTAIMDLSVKFRGDIHGSRSLPEEPVQYLDVVFGQMDDCTGSLSAAGFFQKDKNNTVTWSGGSAMTSSDSNTPAGDPLHYVGAEGRLNVHSGSSPFFGVSALGTHTVTFRRYDDQGNLVEETSAESPQGLQSLLMFLLQPMPFNSTNSVMGAGTRSMANGNGVGVLTWPAVTPVFAPDANTRR